MRRNMTVLLILSSMISTARAQDAFEWRDDFSDAKAWEAMPSWLSNPSSTAKLTTDQGVAAFTVDESKKGMKWRRELPNVWLPEQRFLVVRYRARNVDTGRSDYFIYLADGGMGPECHPIRPSDLKPDGEWHTVAVDVLPIANGESARTMALQVQAAAEGKAVVEVDYISFADRVPDGAEELRGTGFTPAPEAILPLAQARWTAQPSWLANAAENQGAISEGGQAVFRVKDPGRGMKWSWDLPEPTDLAGHRYVMLRYRARDLQGIGDYALCVMGRPAADGGHSYTSAIPLSAILSDGRWHNLTMDATVAAKTIPRVTGVAVQVQAAAADAELAIAEIRFTNEYIPSPLTDSVDVSDGADFAGFKAADMGAVCNAAIGLSLKRLRITGWPEKEQVAVCGIPFRLVQGPSNCLASGVAATGDLRVSVEAKANEVFLLVTAVYAGAEEPVHSRRRDGERLGAIRQTDRFLLRLIYQDGDVDECMPLCLPTRNYEIASGPQVLCAFADPTKLLKEVVLCDKIEQAAFAVSAVSCRVSGDRAFGRFAEETEALRCAPGGGSGFAPSAEGPEVELKADGKDLPLLKTVPTEGGGTAYFFDRGLVATVTATEAGPTERKRQVCLANTGQAPATVRLRGPVLRLKLGQRAEDVYCLYPKSGAVFTNAAVKHSQRFCGDFPVQFMHAFNPKEGIGRYLRTEDKAGVSRSYVFEKNGNGVTFGIEYPERTLAVGEMFRALDTYEGATGGDWHDGFHAYRNWLRSWYPKFSPEKQWFREVFNFRQRFLWSTDPLYDKKEEKFVLESAIEDAAKEFGGMEYLHIFDWGYCGAYGRIYGRTGDYPPYETWKGGREAFAKAIKGVQAQGVPVGLYIEGYLLSQKGLLGQSHGKEWQLIQKDGTGQMWPESTEQYACSFVPAWREVQASTYADRVRELDVNGMYLDQFGFAGAPRDCWSRDHGHPVPGYAVVGERDCTEMVRQRIDGVKKGVALYSEEIPCDLASIHQDGSFTYTMRRAYSTNTMVPLNVFRFALPQFKTIEILVCDHPTGSWAEGVKWIFFNGEAMWIEGKPEWFGENTRAAIRKCHKILRTYKDAFTSLDPEPLVPTEMGGVFANRFSADMETVYTLYNSRHRTVRGEALRVKRRPGAVFYTDVWNGRNLTPRRDGEYDVISVEIGPRDVGCVACGEVRVELRLE